MKLALLVPCRTDCPAPGERYVPDGFGYWSLFQRGEDGAGKMVRRLPAFAL